MTPEHNSPTRRVRRRWLFGLAALAAALVVAVPVAWASHQFTDVPDSNPFHTEITNLAGSGITAGKTCVPTPGTPPTFCPNEPVVRQAMAAFLNRGLGRGAAGAAFDVVIGDSIVELGNVTLNVGGAPGGTQFVKVDAAVGAYIQSVSGCPCSVQFAIFSGDGSAILSDTHYLNMDSVSPSGFGDETGALTTIVPVPTGTTQTFRTFAVRQDPAPAAGTVNGYSSMTAATLAFGSTGGSTLGGTTAGGGRAANWER